MFVWRRRLKKRPGKHLLKSWHQSNIITVVNLVKWATVHWIKCSSCCCSCCLCWTLGHSWHLKEERPRAAGEQRRKWDSLCARMYRLGWFKVTSFFLLGTQRHTSCHTDADLQSISAAVAGRPPQGVVYCLETCLCCAVVVLPFTTPLTRFRSRAGVARTWALQTKVTAVSCQSEQATVYQVEGNHFWLLTLIFLNIWFHCEFCLILMFGCLLYLFALSLLYHLYL